MFQKIFNWILVFIIGWCIVLLCGCSSVSPTKTLSDNVNREIKTIQSDLNSVQRNVPYECQKVVEDALKPFTARLDNLSGEIASIPAMCDTEVKICEKDLGSSRLLNVFLGIIICMLVFSSLRRK